MSDNKAKSTAAATLGRRTGKTSAAAAKEATKAAALLGRLGGKANKGITSDAKAAAARENGRKGGRPRKKQSG